MELDQESLDRAYAIFAEWGPNRRISPRTRLAAAFSQVRDQELDSLLITMAEVDKTVWKIAELGAESKLGKAKVAAILQEKHPFLQHDGLSRATFLANYYAWHEGYAQQ